MLGNGGELEGARILGPRTIAYMASDHVLAAGISKGINWIPGPGYGFGLGFGVRKEPGASDWPGSVGDFYWAGYAGTYFWIDPKEQLVLFLREMGETFCATCRQLLPWLAESGVFAVRFETLCGDDGPEAQSRLVRELAVFVEHANPSEAPDALNGLMTTPTLTSSGSRTKRARRCSSWCARRAARSTTSATGTPLGWP